MKVVGQILQGVIGGNTAPQTDAEIARAIERLRMAERAASQRWRRRAERVYRGNPEWEARKR